jgi:hypothetical protein
MDTKKFKFLIKAKDIIKIITNSTEPKLDEIQIEVVNNITKLMSKPEAILLVAPISNMCYIEWGKYFIRFGNSQATITNGNYSYYFWLPELTTDRLTNLFYKKVEERRMKLDQDYDKKTMEHLKVISKEIDNIN